MKKVIISILTIIVLIMSMTIVVNAEEATGSVSLAASSDNVVKGKTFTVTLAGVSNTNIIGIKAQLSYDSSKIALKSKKVGENFTDASANDNEIAIATGGVGAKSATLCTYTFEVLDTAEEGETTIEVSNITLAADTNINLTKNESVTVTIKSDDTTAGNKEEQKGNNTTTPTNTTDSGNKSTGSGSSKNTTKKTTKLPQTGIESVSVIAIIALGAVGIASYVSYRKYKNI